MSDAFTDRLDKVRQRFMASLEDKIRETYAALPGLAEAVPAARETVVETYRRIHNIVGIGATIGFAETGRAAHSAEAILLTPQRAARGLTELEVRAFEAALHQLRDTAACELRGQAAARGSVGE
jgi:chemotaxis protein histidine kinase CheA